MGFTLIERFKNATSTHKKRKNLLHTISFAARQAYRAASGLQVSEVLDELGLLLPRPVSLAVPTHIEPGHFAALARARSAGKRTGHENIYSRLALDPTQVDSVLEIGIGTNNPKTPSNMGTQGVPGSSLLLWTDLFPRAHVIGADIDPSSFIQTEKIQSFLVDQTSESSLRELCSNFSAGSFDLVVDDGLHTPEANLRTLRILAGLVKPGGWYVIEDIEPAWTPFWQATGSSLEGWGSEIITPDDFQGLMSSFLLLRKI